MRCDICSRSEVTLRPLRGRQQEATSAVGLGEREGVWPAAALIKGEGGGRQRPHALITELSAH